MNDFTLVFLGTGTSQGVPPIGCNHPVCLSNDKRDKRLRASVLVNFKRKNLVVDCGPDFRYQMLREQVSQLSGILFTHEHNDHVAGLDDIRPLVFRQKKNLDVFLENKVLQALQTRYPYIFDHSIQYPGLPRVEPHLIEKETFKIESFLIEPIRVYHGKLPILGFKFNHKIAYITDASRIEGLEKEKLFSLDILILNALREEPKHYSHYVLDEALALIGELKPKQAYLTHISYEMGFHKEVEKKLPEGVSLAYDGLSIKIPMN